MSALFLYYRQTYSVDFLIDVECIDIRHATDVIQYRHDSLLQILVLYVVLAAYPSQELLGGVELADRLGLAHPETTQVLAKNLLDGFGGQIPEQDKHAVISPYELVVEE